MDRLLRPNSPATRLVVSAVVLCMLTADIARTGYAFALAPTTSLGDEKTRGVLAIRATLDIATLEETLETISILLGIPLLRVTRRKDRVLGNLTWRQLKAGYPHLKNFYKDELIWQTNTIELAGPGYTITFRQKGETDGVAIDVRESDRKPLVLPARTASEQLGAWAGITVRFARRVGLLTVMVLLLGALVSVGGKWLDGALPPPVLPSAAEQQIPRAPPPIAKDIKIVVPGNQVAEVRGEKVYVAPGYAVQRGPVQEQKKLIEGLLDTLRESGRWAMKKSKTAAEFFMGTVIEPPRTPQGWLASPTLKGTRRARFLWKPSEERLTGPDLVLLASDGYSEIYYGVTRPDDLRTPEAEEFLKAASAAGFRVYALLGDPAMAKEEGGASAFVEGVFNIGGVHGVVVDIEWWVTGEGPQDIERVQRDIKRVAKKYSKDVLWFTRPDQEVDGGVTTLLAVYETEFALMKDVVQKHQQVARKKKVDYMIVVEAGRTGRGQRESMSFYGRESEIPTTLQRLYTDPDLGMPGSDTGLRSDPHFKGFAIHTDEGYSLRALADEQGEFHLFREIKAQASSYLGSVEEYFQRGRRIRPYGAAPAGMAEKLKEAAWGRVKAVLGGIVGDFYRPMAHGIRDTTRQSEMHGQPTLVASPDAAVPGPELGTLYAMARWLVGEALFAPGQADIQGIRLSLVDKESGAVLMLPRDLLGDPEALALNYTATELQDMRLVLHLDVTGGTEYQQMAAYVQVDVNNTRDLGRGESVTSGPFVVKGGEVNTIRLGIPATFLAEGTDALRIKLISEEQAVAQVGGYEADVILDRIRQEAEDFAATAAKAYRSNRLSVELGTLEGVLHVGSTRLLFVEGQYAKGVNQELLRTLKAGGVSHVVLGADDLLRQEMSQEHYRVLADAAQKAGISLMRINSLRSPPAPRMEDPPSVSSIPAAEASPLAVRISPPVPAPLHYDAGSRTLRVGTDDFEGVQVQRVGPLGFERYVNRMGDPVATRDSMGRVLVYREVAAEGHKPYMPARMAVESPGSILEARTSEGELDHVVYRLGVSGERRVLFYPAREGRAARTVFTFTFHGGTGKIGRKAAEIEFAGDMRNTPLVPRPVEEAGIVRMGVVDKEGRVQRELSREELSEFGKVRGYREFLGTISGPDSEKPYFEQDEDSAWSILYAGSPEDRWGQATTVVKMRGDLRALRGRGLRAELMPGGVVALRVDATEGQDAQTVMLKDTDLPETFSLGGLQISGVQIDRYDVDLDSRDVVPERMARLVRSSTGTRTVTMDYDQEDPGAQHVVTTPEGTKTVDRFGNAMHSAAADGGAVMHYANEYQSDGGWKITERKGDKDGPVVRTVWRDAAGRVVAFQKPGEPRNRVRTELAANGLIAMQTITGSGVESRTEFYVYGDRAGLPRRIRDPKGTRELDYTFDRETGRIAQRQETSRGRVRVYELHVQGELTGLVREAYGGGQPTESHSYKMDEHGFVQEQGVRRGDVVVSFDAQGRRIRRDDIARAMSFFLHTTPWRDGGEVVDEYVQDTDGKRTFARQSRYDSAGHLTGLVDAIRPDVAQLFVPIMSNGVKVAELAVEVDSGRLELLGHRWGVALDAERITLRDEDTGINYAEEEIREGIGDFEYREYYHEGDLRDGKVKRRLPFNDPVREQRFDYVLDDAGEVVHETQTTRSGMQTDIEFKDGLMYSIRGPEGKKIYEPLHAYPDGRRRVMVYWEGQRDRPLDFHEYDAMDRFNEWPIRTARVDALIGNVEEGFSEQGILIPALYDAREIMALVLGDEEFDTLGVEEQRAIMVTYNKILSHLPRGITLLEPVSFQVLAGHRRYEGPTVLAVDRAEGESLGDHAKKAAALAQSLEEAGTAQSYWIAPGVSQEELSEWTRAVKEVMPARAPGRLGGFQGLWLGSVSDASAMGAWKARVDRMERPTQEELKIAAENFSEADLERTLAKDPSRWTEYERELMGYFRLRPSPNVEVGAQFGYVESLGFPESHAQPNAPVTLAARITAHGRDIVEGTVHWSVENMDSEEGPKRYEHQVNLQGGVPTHVAFRLVDGLAPGRYRIASQFLPRHGSPDARTHRVHVRGQTGAKVYGVRVDKPHTVVSPNGKRWRIIREQSDWSIGAGGRPVVIRRGQPAVSLDIKGRFDAGAWRPFARRKVTTNMGTQKEKAVSVTFKVRDQRPRLEIAGESVEIRVDRLLETITLRVGGKDYRLGPYQKTIQISEDVDMQAMLEPEGTIRLAINGQEARVDLNATTVKDSGKPARVLLRGKQQSVQVGNARYRVTAQPERFVIATGGPTIAIGQRKAQTVDLPAGGGQLTIRREENRLSFSLGDLQWQLRRIPGRWVLVHDGEEQVVRNDFVELDSVRLRVSPAGNVTMQIRDSDIVQLQARSQGDLLLEGEEGSVALAGGQEGSKMVTELQVRETRAQETLPATAEVEIGEDAPVVKVPPPTEEAPGGQRLMFALGALMLAWMAARLKDGAMMFWDIRRVRRIREDSRKEMEAAGPVVSRLARWEDMLSRRALVFFGGRRVVPLERQPQYKELIRFHQAWGKGAVVMSEYARSRWGLTAPEPYGVKGWWRNLWAMANTPLWGRARRQSMQLREFTKVFDKKLREGGVDLTEEEVDQLQEMVAMLLKEGVSDASLKGLAGDIARQLKAAREFVHRQRWDLLKEAGLVRPDAPDQSTPWGKRVLAVLGRIKWDLLSPEELEAVARAMAQIQGMPSPDRLLASGQFSDEQFRRLIKMHLLQVSKENDLFSLDAGAQVMGNGSVGKVYQALRDDPKALLTNPAVYPMNLKGFFRGATVSEGMMRLVGLAAQTFDYVPSMVWRALRSWNPKSNTRSTLMFGVKSDVEGNPVEFMLAVKGRWLTGHAAVIRTELKTEGVALAGEPYVEPVRIKERFKSYAQLARARIQESQEATGFNTAKAAGIGAVIAAQQQKNLVFPGELAPLEGLRYLGNWADQEELHGYRELLGKDAREDRLDPDLNYAVVDTDEGITFILPTGDVYRLLTREGDKIGRVSKGAKLGSLVALLLDQFQFKPELREARPAEKAAGSGPWVTDYRRVDLRDELIPELGEADREYEAFREGQRKAAQRFVDDNSSQERRLLHDWRADADVFVRLGSNTGLDPSRAMARLFGKISLPGLKSTLMGPRGLSLLKPLADTHLSSGVHANFTPEEVWEEGQGVMRRDRKAINRFLRRVLKSRVRVPEEEIGTRDESLDKAARLLDGHLEELQPSFVPWTDKEDREAFAERLLDLLEEQDVFLRGHVQDLDLVVIAQEAMQKGSLVGLVDLLMGWELARLKSLRGQRPLPGDNAAERQRNQVLERGLAMQHTKERLRALVPQLSQDKKVQAALEMLGDSLGVLDRPISVGDTIWTETTAYRLAVMAQREGEYRAVGHQVAKLLYHGSLDPGVFKGGDNTFGKPGVRPLRIMEAIAHPEEYGQSRDWTWNWIQSATGRGEQLGSALYGKPSLRIAADTRKRIERFLDVAGKRGLFVEEIVVSEDNPNAWSVVARYPEAREYFPEQKNIDREMQRVFEEMGEGDLFREMRVLVVTPSEMQALKTRSPPFAQAYRKAGSDGRIVRRISSLEDYLVGGKEATFHEYALARSDVELGLDDLDDFVKKLSGDIAAKMREDVQAAVRNNNEEQLEILVARINVFLEEGARAQGVPADKYTLVTKEDLRRFAELLTKAEVPLVSWPFEGLRRARLWWRKAVAPWIQPVLASGLMLAAVSWGGHWYALGMFGLLGLDSLLRNKILVKVGIAQRLRGWYQRHPILGGLLNTVWILAYMRVVLSPVIMQLTPALVAVFLVFLVTGGIQVLLAAIAGAAFDFFFYASEKWFWRFLSLGNAKSLQRHFRSWIHSEDIQLLAKIHGVPPEILDGYWDAAAWSMAIGLPFAPGQVFGRVKLLERSGKIFEAAPVPLLSALITLNEPPPTALMSGFNVLPHTGHERAKSKTEDTYSFEGIALATWNPNWNAAVLLKQKAMAHLVESRLHDQSPQRAAQFAKARGILEYAIPRMASHPLYGEQLKEFQDLEAFLQDMYAMKAMDTDQVNIGRENVGAGFIQYLLTSYTGEDLTDERVGPIPPGVADAVRIYQRMLILDERLGGIKKPLGDTIQQVKLAEDKTIGVRYDQTNRNFSLSWNGREATIAVNRNPVVDPLIVTDTSGNHVTVNQSGYFEGMFPDAAIRVRKSGLGSIVVELGREQIILLVRPYGDGAVLSKPGLFLKAVKATQLLQGDTSDFGEVDYLIPQGLGVLLHRLSGSMRQEEDERELDEQIVRLTRLWDAMKRVETRLNRAESLEWKERAAILDDLEEIREVAYQGDAEAIGGPALAALTRLGDLAIEMKEIHEAISKTQVTLEMRVKENFLTEYFYLPEELLGRPDAKEWLDRPLAELRLRHKEFEAFREGYKALWSGRDPIEAPTYRDIFALEERIETIGEADLRAGSLNREQRVFLKKVLGKEALARIRKKVRQESMPRVPRLAGTHTLGITFALLVAAGALLNSPWLSVLSAATLIPTGAAMLASRYAMDTVPKARSKEEDEEMAMVGETEAYL